jgi:hypothetical protein
MISSTKLRGTLPELSGLTDLDTLFVPILARAMFGAVACRLGAADGHECDALLAVQLSG